MLTIYLKAVSAAFRQTLGDLWGVLWRPRHTLQEIFERGTWGSSLILLLLAGYLGVPGMVKCIRVSVGCPHNHQLIIGMFNFSSDGYLFLLGLFVTLILSIRLCTKTVRWYSFLRIAGYCVLPSILLVIGIYFPWMILTQYYSSIFHASGIGSICLWIITLPFAIFLILRLINIMLNIACPAMTSKQCLVSIIVAFLGGNIVLNIFVNLYRTIWFSIWHTFP